MEILDTKTGIKVLGIKDTSFKHIFDCGQCFRFEEQDDGAYIGVAHGRVIRCSQEGDTLYFDGITRQDFKEVFCDYFDLSTDYGEIKSTLSRDAFLSEAQLFGWGIRIVRQDAFEALISFIISQQNNIPRIKKIISALCERYGEKLQFEGKTYYAFPTPEALFGVCTLDLDFLKSGYRAGYICDAVNKVASGEIDLKNIATLPTDKARQELLKIHGVGNKVADCVLLFGMHKLDVFPKDVWINKVLSLKYPADFNSTEYFGEYAGVAQQYMFYFGRETKIG